MPARGYSPRGGIGLDLVGIGTRLLLVLEGRLAHRSSMGRMRHPRSSSTVAAHTKGRLMKARILLKLLPVGAMVGCLLVASCGGDDAPTAATDDASPAASSGQVPIGTQGGKVDLLPDKLTLSVPTGALSIATEIEAHEVRQPPELPAHLTAAGPAFEITVSNQDLIAHPLQFTIPYDSSATGTPLVMHYTPASGYRPATIVDRDPQAGLIRFESRSFSQFRLAMQGEIAPAHHVVNTFRRPFDPVADGFSIPNVAYPALTSDCGTCMGMVVVARWHFEREQAFQGRFTPKVQATLAILAHAGVDYDDRAYDDSANQTPLGTVNETKALLAEDEPVILVIENAAGERHAVLAFAYDTSSVHVYDPNEPGRDIALPYSQGGFAPYGGYTTFRALVGETSLAPKFDIDRLIDQAESGFVTSLAFELTSPDDQAQLTARRGQLSGTLTNPSIERIKAITRAGMQEVVPVNGKFDAAFPVFGGANDLILLGGPHDRSRLSYARSGGVVRSFTSQLAPAELFTMLTWDQDADVDLYVHSPANAQAVAWYDGKQPPGGLVLDIDDKIRGPELVTLSVGDKAQPGSIDPGAYRIRAHYYDGTVPISGEALIAINENQGPRRALCRISFAIPSSNKNNDQPGDTGADWVDIATVDVGKGEILAVPPLVCRNTSAPFVQRAPRGTLAHPRVDGTRSPRRRERQVCSGCCRWLPVGELTLMGTKQSSDLHGCRTGRLP